MKGGFDCQLRSRKKALQGRGFTIVETLIVLAVTMAMFLAAVLLINGKQHATEFNQSVRAVQDQLQQLISDVGSGYYSSDGKITCQNNGGKPQLGVGTDITQGANKDCLFMGKVTQFGVAGTDPERYNVYTLVGLRDTATGNGTFDLQKSGARVIAKGTAEAATGIPDEYDSRILQYGLTVQNLYYGSNPGSNHIGAIGFVSNLSDLGTDNGAGRTDIIAIRGTSLHASTTAGVDDINRSTGGNGDYIVNPDSGVSICLASGGTNQSGLITIGGGDRQADVDLKIFSNRTCTP